MPKAKKMTEEQLRKQREQRRKELIYVRDWLHSHPHRVDPDIRPAAIDYLNGCIAELERMDKPEQMKSTRLAGRVRLRDRIRTLVAVILTQHIVAREVGK